MPMPVQLRRGLERARRKGFKSRPEFEELPAIDVRKLARRKMFPGDWISERRYQNFGFIVPGIKELVLSRHSAVIVQASGTQTVPIYWRPVAGKCEGSLRP